jgi:uncharacterized hydrophobic protein (TIGR00271 family)
MKDVIRSIRNFFHVMFNLDEDKAEEDEIVSNIHRDVSFKGANLWTLIFAIMIASIGLNVNSTAVIIGAMLISPLMGPIMGVGLAVGTNDVGLFQRGIQNYVIALVISILTSFIYFSATPIHEVNSELLARTNPSLFDVFIAFFGGLAGIVASTRARISNVIPGVAIATALMPPLCTAGYGLAMGRFTYFFGALYLFFINSLLICLATFLIVRHLRFRKKQFQTRSQELRVSRYIWTIVIITVLPSIYLAWRIVEKSIVTRNYKMDASGRSIEILVVGQKLSDHVIDSIGKRMPLYGLDSVRFVVHQGLDADQEIDMAQIRASILEEFYGSDPADTLNAPPDKIDLPIPDLTAEFKTLFPNITTYSLTQSVFKNLDSTRQDTISLLAVQLRSPSSASELKRLQTWVKQRIQTDSLRLIVE